MWKLWKCCRYIPKFIFWNIHQKVGGNISRKIANLWRNFWRNPKKNVGETSKGHLQKLPQEHPENVSKMLLRCAILSKLTYKMIIFKKMRKKTWEFLKIFPEKLQKNWRIPTLLKSAKNFVKELTKEFRHLFVGTLW